MTEFSIRVEAAAAADHATPMLALPMLEGEGAESDGIAGIDARLQGEIGRLVTRSDFEAGKDEVLLLYPRTGELGAERLVLLGLGKRDDFVPERLRVAVGLAVRQAERVGAPSLSLPLGHLSGSGGVDGETLARAAAEAAEMAAWDYRELKTASADEGKGPVKELVLLVDADDGAEVFRQGARLGQAVGQAVNLARDLAVKPGNVATPSHLANVAEQIAGQFRMDVSVLDRAGIREAGMHALLAVAAGTDEEPRFITLEYNGAGEADVRPLVLVGKGITFDSGGISIKPADKMDRMKYDMSGAAAVLGAMRAIGALELRANVVALIPATENLLSGRALKPGDVIRSHSGKTIEIVNTDAEGRLILADALSVAGKYNPQAIVDTATLTGSCLIALGTHAAGLMGNDAALLEEVRGAGEVAGERCWTLPLWDDYRSQIDSQVADVQNLGGRAAGTITAGWFLREFVGQFPWAHLDIAGTAWKDEPPSYLRKGPSGIPARLLVEWVRRRAEG